MATRYLVSVYDAHIRNLFKGIVTARSCAFHFYLSLSLSLRRDFRAYRSFFRSPALDCLFFSSSFCQTNARPTARTHTHASSGGENNSVMSNTCLIVINSSSILPSLFRFSFSRFSRPTFSRHESGREEKEKLFDGIYIVAVRLPSISSEFRVFFVFGERGHQVEEFCDKRIG